MLRYTNASGIPKDTDKDGFVCNRGLKIPKTTLAFYVLGCL